VTSVDRASVADLHSHLVPRVDDGARTLKEALEAVERMVADGIGQTLTKPHVNASLTRDSRGLGTWLEEVGESWQELSEHVRRRFPDVEFLRGHEVMLDAPPLPVPPLRIREGIWDRFTRIFKG